MSRSFFRSFLLLILGIVAALPASAQDGLFADFSTTQGDFTCQLHFDRAPKTVANFIGLATGEQAWLNLPTSEVKRRPFYNGLTFHRVVAGFVIQGGSPNGTGTDGPGYHFRDEFHPTLRHTGAGILSMANSGRDTNGSQFFVTLAAASHLDELHSVFGEVTSGMEVVNAIGGVPVGAGSRPITPVVMHSVTIRRVGAAALAFNVASQGLPVVGGANPQLTRMGASYFLQYPIDAVSEYGLSESDDLRIWTSQPRLGFFVTAQPAASRDITATVAMKSRYFYRVPRVTYPGPVFPPQTLFGKRVRFVLQNGETAEYTLNNSGGGTAVINGGQPGTIQQYVWTPEAYRASRLYVIAPPFPLEYFPHFTSEGGGTFRGTGYGATNFAISGTFTVVTVP